MRQNTSIEVRVALLELQVANLDEDVDFLFDEQVIQDEKLLNLEQETEEIDEQLIIVDDVLEGKNRFLVPSHKYIVTIDKNKIPF